MTARKSYALILVAYCMTLLHASTPHQHSGIRTGHPVIQARKEADNSLAGLLQSAFSTDLGCGHLETFAKSDANLDFSFAVAPVPLVFLLSYPTYESDLTVPELFGSYIEKLHTRTILYSSRQFRAPPVLA